MSEEELDAVPSSFASMRMTLRRKLTGPSTVPAAAKISRSGLPSRLCGGGVSARRAGTLPKCCHSGPFPYDLLSTSRAARRVVISISPPPQGSRLDPVISVATQVEEEFAFMNTYAGKPSLPLAARTLLYDYDRGEPVMSIEAALCLPIGSQIDLGDVTGPGGLRKNVTATVTGIRLKVEPEDFLLTLDVDVPAGWYARGSSKPVGRRRSERGSES